MPVSRSSSSPFKTNTGRASYYVATLKSPTLLPEDPLSAWKRVKSWYEVGEWPPSSEWIHWQMNPSGELLRLARDLTDGTYKPAPFRLVPYPKSGGIIRHYSTPSIRDQVLFTAFGILLAPFLEAQMPNFSFGNRWYRSIYRRYGDGTSSPQLDLFGAKKPIWDNRPFSLGDRKAYQPYARSHGLFRRVAHWAATSMLRVTATDTEATDVPKEREDYARESIPPFAKPDWWRSENVKGEATPQPLLKGYWAHLDLQLAYPSLNLDYLAGSLLRCIRRERTDPDVHCLDDFGAKGGNDNLLKGYPVTIALALLKEDARLWLAERFVKYLKIVQYEAIPYTEGDVGVRNFLWVPPHVSADLVGHNCLPTGLLISGLLMNVALLAMDARMAGWMNNQQDARQSSAFLRFADDMIIMAQKPIDLARGIDTLWDGLNQPEGGVVPVLAAPSTSVSSTNLRVNWSKLKPEPLAVLLKQYLKVQGWLSCPACEMPVTPPPELKFPSKRLADFYQEQSGDWGPSLEDAALRPDRLGPFLTYLVERLSVLGRDTLRTRFGRNAQDHIVQLHELVRFDLQDEQVREDTRLSFAANRLVKVWLQEQDVKGDRQALRQIRWSIQIAVSKAPWKFGLWRSVVQAASRRPPGRAAEEDEITATAWLQHMLKQIAFGEENLLDSRADEDSSLFWVDDHNKPGCWESQGENSPNPKMLLQARRILTLSYLRTAFWRALGQTIQELHWLKYRLTVRDSGQDSFEWRSSQWTFRAMSESEIESVLGWLSNIDNWTATLYPAVQRNTLAEKIAVWWWERDAFAVALSASLSRDYILSHVNEAALKFPLSPVSNEIFNLDTLLLEALSNSVDKAASPSYAVEILSKSAAHHSGNSSAWASVFLAFPGAGKEALSAALSKGALFNDKKPDWIAVSERLRLARIFQVLDQLPQSFKVQLVSYQRLNPKWWESPAQLMRRWHDLEVYGEIRQISFLIDRPAVEPRAEFNLQQLLWGFPKVQVSRGSNLRKSWSTLAPDAPAIGVPTRIALAMMSDALHCVTGGARGGSEPPNWLICKDRLSTLLRGRMAQLGCYNLQHQDFSRDKKKKRQWIQACHGLSNWDVLPHPAFYMPAALGLVSHYGLELDLWAHALLFYMALEGSERFLDLIVDRGPGAVPFMERWDIRSRHSLGSEIWEALDKIIGLCGFRNQENVGIPALLADFKSSLDRLLSKAPASIYDFRWERVDVLLDLNRSLEVPLAVLPFGDDHQGRVPSDEFNVKEGGLIDTMVVRMGQLRAEPDWEDILRRFPALTRAETQRVMAEVWGSLFSQGGADGAGSHKPHLIIFPEVSIPRSEVRVLQRAVGESGIAVFCGLLWRSIPHAIRSREPIGQRKRFFVNEGLLSIPLQLEGDGGPPLVRSFFVEKPIPAAVEKGLAVALSRYRESPARGWQVLPGRKWFRFVHPSWGDFTVAICSDLLDASPWVALRGSIMHLFMCAYNHDVELYEALTWVRAYENYVNMVSVNHGCVGGSFAWSPQRGDKKEIAKLRGGHLLINADVILPVKELWIQQRSGLSESVERAAEKWLRPSQEGKKKWKTPPPEFPSRDE